MKYLLLPTFMMMLLSCGSKAVTHTEAIGEIYGEAITPEGAVDAASIINMLENNDSANVKIKTTIAEVCQKKGCWMDVAVNDTLLMTVLFKDYAFFVPKDAAGKSTILEGTVRKEVESVEWLKHKAQDAGKAEAYINSIVAPKTSYTFEALGVIIQ